MIVINTEQELQECRNRGFEPLIDKLFSVDISLRKQEQERLFGTGNTQDQNQKFYEFAYRNSKVKKCENCFKPLHYYSAAFVSHILSRSSYPQFAYDLRNFNLLCVKCHWRWENFNKGMNIYYQNQETIKEIKK